MTEPSRDSGSWILPEKHWIRMEYLLPKYKAIPKGGRPRVDLRRVANGIFYVLRTGCQWNAVPREFGTGSTLHRYFQQWTEAGVFAKSGKRLCLNTINSNPFGGIGKALTER